MYSTYLIGFFDTFFKRNEKIKFLPWSKDEIAGKIIKSLKIIWQNILLPVLCTYFVKTKHPHHLIPV